MALVHCPLCSLPLTQAEALQENCPACGGVIAPRAEKPSEPAAPVPAAARRRRVLVGWALAGALALLLPVTALLAWHWDSAPRAAMPDTQPAPADRPIVAKRPEPKPVTAQPELAAEAASERAEVAYPPETLAQAKPAGDGMTDGAALTRVKPGGMPAPAEAPAPRVADNAEIRPDPLQNLREPLLPRLPGPHDRELDELLGMHAQARNQLQQPLKMAGGRDPQLDKLFNMAGMQDLDLLDAVKAIQGFGQVQGLVPPRPPVARPAPAVPPVPAAPPSEATELTLSGNGISDQDLLPVRGQTALRVLGLTGTGITDAGLEHLKGLKALRLLFLSGTAVTDRGLEQLHGLTELRELDLSNTAVTNAGLQRLRQALPELKITR